MTGRGVRVNVVTHRVVMTSDKSVMWSLCRWVSSSAVMSAGADAHGRQPACSAPRPQSTRNV